MAKLCSFCHPSQLPLSLSVEGDGVHSLAAGTERGESYHHSRGAVCTAEGDSGTRDPFTGIPEGVQRGRGWTGL